MNPCKSTLKNSEITDHNNRTEPNTKYASLFPFPPGRGTLAGICSICCEPRRLVFTPWELVLPIRMDPWTHRHGMCPITGSHYILLMPCKKIGQRGRMWFKCIWTWQTDAMTWVEASESCWKTHQQAHLAEIKNEEEKNFIRWFIIMTQKSFASHYCFLYQMAPVP